MALLKPVYHKVMGRVLHVIQIGPWDMDSKESIEVELPEGIPVCRDRICIVDDDGLIHYPNLIDIKTELFTSENKKVGNRVVVSRPTAGKFDNSKFNDTKINRGAFSVILQHDE